MFADVILPLPLPDLFTYSVPKEMEQTIGRGYRVVVPFGSRKHYTGIVMRLHDEPPQHFETKEIHSSIDSHPVVDEQQIKLWEWISFYYLSPLGDVYKAALPPPMKPEDLKGELKPRTETYIRLNPKVKKATEEEVTTCIGRAKKQLALFKEIKCFVDNLHETVTTEGIRKRPYPKKPVRDEKPNEQQKRDGITKKRVMEFNNYSPSVLNGLIAKGILETYEVEVAKKEKDLPFQELTPLNEPQLHALEAIKRCLKERPTCLLHGVAGSGKTKLYMHLAKEYIERGQQVLYLMPEIALTTRLTKRLKAAFGNKMALYHSEMSERERVEVWNKMQSDEPYQLILGVRSSLFLPYKQLGLIVVDEEHETSYKQQDPSPRYHARDTAIILAHIAGAKTLLGSATPSMESYHNAKKGKFGLVELKTTYNHLTIPEVLIEDTHDLRKRKKMKSLLAPSLIEAITEAMADGEQVILFRNRRGFASWVECKNCGWVSKCTRCEVALTYHKRRGQLVCHYCNGAYPLPHTCPKCNNEELKPLGIGTERIEEEVKQLFPEATVARVDADTTGGKGKLERVIDRFRENEVQIVVGTQMLSKGFDFENVRVIGIVAADSLLNYPDFRSHERGFQLMVQAVGRAAREHGKTRVIIQSNDPGQPIYTFIREGDIEGFYHLQLQERKLFNYPPFGRLIRIIFKHKSESIADAAASRFAQRVKRALHERVLGPNIPVVNRVQQHHIREVLLKLENELPLQPVRDLLKKTEEELRADQRFRYVTLYYDVDPV
ncbi:MAG: primosomal protein N' [Bacteroidota bacterium]|jgi:primosomal protein N' (replication factor Y)|nr:primosomal protein N' [Bacteroidota bacterium]HHU97364.1 primosomal protein N' [Petrimonas sp.]